jgi:hypothetical protein
MKPVWITPSKGGGSTAQAVEILQVTAMDLRTSSGKRRGCRIGASEAEHLMARLHDLLNNSRTDKACSTRDEDTHYDFSFSSLHDDGRVCSPV